jgi:hypothetical protein
MNVEFLCEIITGCKSWPKEIALASISIVEPLYWVTMILVFWKKMFYV